MESELKKAYDLEPRTFKFAEATLAFLRKTGRSTTNRVLVQQLVRSATSVGANFIEANESLSRKDFVMRIKICRKEAKESAYWLRLLQTNDDSIRGMLLREAVELTKIFGAIVSKSEPRSV
jgi:four helix bundle protein